MVVVIAGSRDIQDGNLVAAAVAASGFEITEVVSGTCKGVDECGEQWATERGIPVRRFPAESGRLGRRAGPVRNEKMIQYAAASGQGAVVAVWDGMSPGTRHTIQYARQRGVAVYVHRV